MMEINPPESENGLTDEIERVEEGILFGSAILHDDAGNIFAVDHSMETTIVIRDTTGAGQLVLDTHSLKQLIAFAERREKLQNAAFGIDTP